MDKMAEDRSSIKVECELVAKLVFVCPVTGNQFMSMDFVSTGQAYTDTEAARRCVQAFIDGRLSSLSQIYEKVDVQCTPHQGVDHIDVRFPEPLRSLLLDLFDPASWCPDSDAYRAIGTVKLLN